MFGSKIKKEPNKAPEPTSGLRPGLSAKEIDALTTEIDANLDVALELIAASQARRFKHEKKT